jgi:hypothetical protein
MELTVQITEPDPFMYSTDFTMDECDETGNGTIQMMPLTNLPFSFTLTNSKGEMVAWGKQDANLFWENLTADKYTLKIETACESYEEEFDLRDPNAIHYDFSVSMLKDADNHAKINVFMGPINATEWTWTLNNVAYHNYSMLGLDYVEGGENTAVLTASNGYCSTVVTRRATAVATDQDSLVFQVNSTSEYVQIRTKQQTTQRADVRLLDMTGKQVFQESNADLSAGFIQVPWKQLAAGMYIVQLTTKNAVLLNQQVVK